jgi:hypothetical protein
MGMFDYFKIDYPLPLESYIISMYRPFINAVVNQDEFQSKDLDCCMDKYYIDNAGRIYRAKMVDFESDEREQYNKIYYHGHIKVHTIVSLDEEGWDSDRKFWLEYDLKFTDSLLVSATMLHPTKEELDELRLYTDL